MVPLVKLAAGGLASALGAGEAWSAVGVSAAVAIHQTTGVVGRAAVVLAVTVKRDCITNAENKGTLLGRTCFACPFCIIMTYQWMVDDPSRP